MSSQTFINLGGGSTVFVALPAGEGVEVVPIEPRRVPFDRYLPFKALEGFMRYEGYRTFWTGSRWARGERLPTGTIVRGRREQETLDITLS